MHVVVSYSYVDDERIVVRVVKTACIFFQESDNGAFSLCCLWYGACQLNILDYPKVSFAGFLDDLVVTVLPMIILMFPTSGLGRSLSRRGSCS